LLFAPSTETPPTETPKHPPPPSPIAPKYGAVNPLKIESLAALTRRRLTVRQPSAKFLTTERKIEAFLTNLATAGVSGSTQNQAFNALLFFYRQVLKQELGPVNSLRAKRPVHVRQAPTQDEVRRLFGSGPDPKAQEAAMAIVHRVFREDDPAAVDEKRKCAKIISQAIQSGVPFPDLDGEDDSHVCSAVALTATILTASSSRCSVGWTKLPKRKWTSGSTPGNDALNRRPPSVFRRLHFLLSRNGLRMLACACTVCSEKFVPQP
jgi:hypothetical protein